MMLTNWDFKRKQFIHTQFEAVGYASLFNKKKYEKVSWEIKSEYVEASILTLLYILLLQHSIFSTNCVFEGSQDVWQPPLTSKGGVFIQ